MEKNKYRNIRSAWEANYDLAGGLCDWIIARKIPENVQSSKVQMSVAESTSY